MTAKNPDGRLCPRVSCGQDEHLLRIPPGTELKVQRVIIARAGMWDVPWYKVEYQGKSGYVSEMMTDRRPKGVGKDFCPRNPRGLWAGCHK